MSNVSDIDFSIDDTDPEVTAVVGKFSVLKAHRALQHYLETCQQDPTSLEKTLFKIDAMLCSRDPKKKKKKEDAAEHEHGMFTHVLLDLVWKIPYHHSAQDDLVRLVISMQNMAKLGTIAEDKATWVNAVEIYAKLTVNFEPGTPEEQQSINEYAFLARLSAAGILGDVKFATTHLKAMLEADVDYENNDPLYSGRIAEATMWIIYAGQWLFKELVQSPCAREPSDKGAFLPGPLYSGSILGITRWLFWKKVLEVARESTRVSDETRRLTTKAVDFMNALEQLNA
ncbi:hypothetical protein N7456_006113 [Penicillium angulare]|uniref:Uncharacterized protein n=1 Tax=Penicillium angulare TaxID=116970 RepID=A0A9W9KL58_9EURO|nr:hypothetical protein N7456_006113 [Penicillium angulare]